MLENCDLNFTLLLVTLLVFSPNFFFHFFKLEIFWVFSKMTFQGIKVKKKIGISVFFGCI